MRVVSKAKPPAHLMGNDGKVYCLPVIVLYMSSGSDPEWSEWKDLFGGGFINWIVWFFGGKFTSDDFEEVRHIRYERDRICHKWRGKEYLYDECSISR